MSDNRYGKLALSKPRKLLSHIGWVIGLVGIGLLIYGSATSSPHPWVGGVLMFGGGLLYMLPRLGRVPLEDIENAPTRTGEPRT